MGEWPKTCGAIYGAIEMADDALKGVEVIPADLGQELYEALQAVADWEPVPEADRVLAAIARYESEVGP